MSEYTVESTRAYLPASILNIGLVDSPEPITTSTGEPRGRALYDAPPPGTQTEELRRSDRARTATKRAQGGYLQSRAKSNERSAKYRRTRALSQSQDVAQTQPADEAANTEAEWGAFDRAGSKSPTPIPTSTEQEAQPRLDRQEVQCDLTRRFWSTLADNSTQTLVEVLHDISKYPAHAIRSQAPDPEVFMLSPAPVSAGGGFHLDHPAHGGPNLTREGPATSTIRKPPFKVPPPIHAKARLDLDDNTDTEPEDEDYSQPIPPPRLTPRLPTPPFADAESPFVDRNAAFGVLAYPPTRTALPPSQAPQNIRSGTDHNAPSADPNVPPSNSDILPLNNVPSPLGPSLPTHSQLRTERSITHVSTSSRSLADPISTSQPNLSQPRAERSLTHLSTSSKSLGDPIPPLGQGASRRAASQTESSQHSHRTPSQQLGSQPPTHDPLPPPESLPGVTQKGATTRTRARGSVLDMAAIDAQRAPSQTSGAGPSRRLRGHTRNPAPWPSPSARTPHPRSRSSTATHRPAPTPCPQPRVSQPRSSQPPAPSSARSRAPSDMLPGDDSEEEGVSDYEAAAKAVRSAAQGHNPSMLDLEGTEHFIVLKVKDVLWAFGIHEGSFQIRSAYCIWFEGIYRQVFIKELPGETYRRPSDTACVVVVNSIPSRRGHVKERLRSIVKAHLKFVHPKNDAERASNVKIYHVNMPNRFHLLDPEKNIGYYESELIDDSIAAAFFYSPTAIGVKFPNYFEKMENSIVAFILSMIQFCISEWEGGSFTKKNLDADFMLGLYICHYEGLKVADSVEDGPMPELRERWYKGALASSQASAPTKKFVQPITRAEDIRRSHERRQPRGASQTSPPPAGPSGHLSTPHPSSRHSTQGPAAPPVAESNSLN